MLKVEIVQISSIKWTKHAGMKLTHSLILHCSSMWGFRRPVNHKPTQTEEGALSRRLFNIFVGPLSHAGGLHTNMEITRKTPQRLAHATCSAPQQRHETKRGGYEEDEKSESQRNCQAWMVSGLEVLPPIVSLWACIMPECPLSKPAFAHRRPLLLPVPLCLCMSSKEGECQCQAHWPSLPCYYSLTGRNVNELVGLFFFWLQ